MGQQKATKRGKRKWKIVELFADGRCSEAILEFLGPTDVGRKVPTEKATEAESSESGTEQECPRGECVCGFPRVHVMRHCAFGLNAAFGECGPNCGS